jgi:hypothetical protein
VRSGPALGDAVAGHALLQGTWGKAATTAASFSRGTPMESRNDTLRRSLPVTLIEISCGHAQSILASWHRLMPISSNKNSTCNHR